MFYGEKLTAARPAPYWRSKALFLWPPETGWPPNICVARDLARATCCPHNNCEPLTGIKVLLTFILSYNLLPQFFLLYINQIQIHAETKVYLISTHSQIQCNQLKFISVINQLGAQNFCFTISLFHASTCFEHMWSSSGGQNCITQPLVSSHL